MKNPYDFLCTKCQKDVRVICERELTAKEQDELKIRMLCQPCLKIETGEGK
jgi:hypothetical protein